MHNKTLEHIGAFFGVVGALLIAMNIPESKYGFLLFMVSSTAFMLMGYKQQMYSFLASQVVFTMINLIGIYNWFI